MPISLKHILSLDDFEKAARRHLPHPLFMFVASAAQDGHTIRANRSSFDDFALVPRVLVDISRRTTEKTLLGQTWKAPFGISPVGVAALCAYRGDIVMAKAAAAAGIPMALSGASLIHMEEVVAQAPGTWFQAYMPGDEPRTFALVERVAQNGFDTMVITLDTAVAANRENNTRAGFHIPLRPSLRLAWDGVSHPRWLLGTMMRTLLHHGMPHFENTYATRGVPIISRHVERGYSERGHLHWKHFEKIRDMWKGRLLVKGVLSVHDARQARDLGADGVIVSNHGGRQLDGAVAPMRVLPGIVAACPDLPVMLDGGIRRGGDVLKALALGAQFVFTGRPFIFAAAVAGEAGVRHAISLLSAEVDRDMALLGITHLDQLNRDHLFRLASPSGEL